MLCNFIVCLVYFEVATWAVEPVVLLGSRTEHAGTGVGNDVYSYLSPL